MRFKDLLFRDILAASFKWSAWIALLYTLLGCSHFGVGTQASYDDRSISVLTSSLFNQRLSPRYSKQSWKGDWLFRRERLELIDRDLQAVRPDLLVFQELLARRGSPSESDRSILSYGALDGYQWEMQLARFYEDTQEEQFFALAMGLPLRPGDRSKSSVFKLGVDGAFSISQIFLEDEPIWVVNVEMPQDAQKVDVWYDVLTKKLREYGAKESICEKRLIVAGYLPGRLSWPFYQRFLRQFNLKDTSTGFCEVATDCQTGTPSNEIFLNTSEGKSGTQVDRILAHAESVVYASSAELDNADKVTTRGEVYGLHSHWPTRRFAWNSILRLPKCVGIL
ncbi:hypothetical protein [Pseudobacteriovorax antillogorgiicola]|uniref:Endonuclease/Exonuclease/phosphatase family protein n=1 Tax=Pseudobacteriovorax antillogorgiicola TaxID=1513793 RepID=A0A1Y6CCQ1_9BACT|nr:hypothetical protein [Pseudobacteriovorax antillogorgiicola]TCS49480.1 hypothetical protein EDD56_115162 [Pseudobacteriovorax antillogorgiicola]SMF46120.1 hypothetical protein SAMN06296036_11423 [Pseudobacteriovorax antillogorgiicola]